MREYNYKSIKDKGGLKVHLDATKEKHHGFGYRVWRIARVAGVNTTARAKLFNVSYITARDWTNVDDAEQKVENE